MIGLSIEYTDIRPMKPADADYGITIDFERGSSDPVKVFEAMVRALSGFREIDELILGAADPDLVPVIVLEDVEAASITSWVKRTLKLVDDDALKDLDWRKQVGKYAHRAKYRVLEYLDEREVKNETKRINVLRDDLLKLANENPTGRDLPLPNPIPLEILVRPLDKIQDAKRLLGPSDRMIFKEDDGEHELDKSITKKPSRHIKRPEKDSAGAMEMVLTLRKPDLLGHSQWEFKHGNSSFSATIADEEWLDELHKGRVNILSGAAMACTVAYRYEYDASGSLIHQNHSVVKVHDIIPPQAAEQGDLLG